MTDPSKRELLFHLALINWGYSPYQISEELLSLDRREAGRGRQLEQICKNIFRMKSDEFPTKDLQAILPISNKIINKLFTFPTFQILKRGELEYNNTFGANETRRYQVPPVVYIFGNTQNVSKATRDNRLGIWSENKSDVEKDEHYEEESKEKMGERIIEDGRITVGSLDNEYGVHAFNIAKKINRAIGIANHEIPESATLPQFTPRTSYSLQSSSIISINPPFLELLPYQKRKDWKSQKYTTYSMMKRITSEIFNPRSRKK